jgi:diacylglycerol O-acyltransferase
MVEGFPDGTWAVISKVHHCMVDGISGTELMVRLLDDTPDAVLADPPPPWRPRPAPRTRDLVADALAGAARKPLEQIRAAGTVIRERATLAAGVSSYLDHTHAAPPLSIEGPIGPHRSWASTTVGLDDIKRIRGPLGGTVNDVLLTLTTAGFRALMLSRGDEPAESAVHTLVPVSVRDPSDTSSNNQITAIIASLPVHLKLPHDRLHAICAQMNELKGSHQAETGAVLMSTIDALTPPMLVSALLRGATALVRWLPQQRVNTVTTNVPGPRQPLYARGRRMVAYHPFVPIAQGMRVGVAMLSYDGRVGFGLTGDWDSVPDLQPMVDGIRAELDALLAEADAAAPATPRARSRA